MQGIVLHAAFYGGDANAFDNESQAVSKKVLYFFVQFNKGENLSLRARFSSCLCSIENAKIIKFCSIARNAGISILLHFYSQLLFHANKNACNAASTN